MKQQTQFTPDGDEYSDEALKRLIDSVTDDGISSGLMYMAATPDVTVAPSRDGAIALAEAWRRAMAPVARTLTAGDIYDGLTRFLAAARSAQAGDDVARPMVATTLRAESAVRPSPSAAAGGEVTNAAQ